MMNDECICVLSLASLELLAIFIDVRCKLRVMGTLIEYALASPHNNKLLAHTCIGQVRCSLYKFIKIALERLTMVAEAYKCMFVY